MLYFHYLKTPDKRLKTFTYMASPYLFPYLWDTFLFCPGINSATLPLAGMVAVSPWVVLSKYLLINSSRPAIEMATCCRWVIAWGGRVACVCGIMPCSCGVTPRSAVTIPPTALHRDRFANQHRYIAADLLSSSIARTQICKLLKSQF